MTEMFPKSIQNRAKWYPGAFRKRPGVQIGSKIFRPGTFCQAFHATWAMLGATWEATGCRGGPKNQHSGTKMLSNDRTSWMRMGVRKTVLFYLLVLGCWISFNTYVPTKVHSISALEEASRIQVYEIMFL